jgi:predicted ABC-type ATPase
VKRDRPAQQGFDLKILDHRPVIVALAGPNGAGKTTFFHSYLAEGGLRFLNADLIARELKTDAYTASQMLTAVREELLKQRESFILETVFSDPVRDKLNFLKKAAQSGYNVVLCFIGLSDADISEQRVAMRVSQGGHDVPSEKLIARFPRVIANLKAAIHELPTVLIFDNSDLNRPFRLIMIYQARKAVARHPPIPRWVPR